MPAVVAIQDTAVSRVAARQAKRSRKILQFERKSLRAFQRAAAAKVSTQPENDDCILSVRDLGRELR